MTTPEVAAGRSHQNPFNSIPTTYPPKVLGNPNNQPVFLPRFETDPAEVVLALGALHVVAAFVLLNRRLAGGTRLGVGHEPKAVDGRLRLGVGVVQLLGTD